MPETDVFTLSIGLDRPVKIIAHPEQVVTLTCSNLKASVVKGYIVRKKKYTIKGINAPVRLKTLRKKTRLSSKRDLSRRIIRQANNQRIYTSCRRTNQNNSYYISTNHISDQPEEEQEEKKAVIVTARVHPGESQASWMMKGVLDYITGSEPEAQVILVLRNQFYTYLAMGGFSKRYTGDTFFIFFPEIRHENTPI